MKEIAIRLEYKDKTYLSNYDEFNEQEEKQLIAFIEKLVKQDVSWISFKSDNIKCYLPKQVIEESIKHYKPSL